MADERDEWLDQDAAERLLRGEPVGPVDDHAREQARRVARALEAMRASVDPAAGELPGEAAALAAFREARAAKGTGPRAANGAGPRGAVTAPGASSDLGTVRIQGVPRRRARWARPVRWGLAASVAGLAVGGVAVAAGTGVLPVLGGDREPVPASSVTAAATPTSGGQTGGTDSATPGTPSAPGSVAPSTSAGQGADAGGTERVPGRPDPERTGNGDDGSGRPGSGTGATDGGAPGSDDSAVTVRACRDYRAGRLDRERRRQLEAQARGAANVKSFCDRVLAGATRPGTGGGADTGTGTGTGTGGKGTGGKGADGGKGTGGQGDDGGGDSGEDGAKNGGDPADWDATQPSASWSLAPALSVPQPAAAS
ncbi:hypothetical protein QWM81_18045 [Streptomyces ficellus]|uniref:Extensin n=1 Tax=Streptomyces ficellus TaxID=1977088 RepID=A0ABT7Z8U2_9ACTN|nr:hypothetical protein [Streptomyces ficellus]MDN3295919.1 hypothetical protein [Streptomyces ficellus]